MESQVRKEGGWYLADYVVPFVVRDDAFNRLRKVVSSIRLTALAGPVESDGLTACLNVRETPVHAVQALQ